MKIVQICLLNEWILTQIPLILYQLMPINLVNKIFFPIENFEEYSISKNILSHCVHIEQYIYACGLPGIVVIVFEVRV